MRTTRAPPHLRALSSEVTGPVQRSSSMWSSRCGVQHGHPHHSRSPVGRGTLSPLPPTRTASEQHTGGRPPREPHPGHVDGWSANRPSRSARVRTAAVTLLFDTGLLLSDSGRSPGTYACVAVTRRWDATAVRLRHLLVSIGRRNEGEVIHLGRADCGAVASVGRHRPRVPKSSSPRLRALVGFAGVASACSWLIQQPPRPPSARIT
jgi:hypothetical protein